MLFAVGAPAASRYLESGLDKAMDGWTAHGRTDGPSSAHTHARSAVHKSLILTVPLPTLSTASSTTEEAAPSLARSAAHAQLIGQT